MKSVTNANKTNIEITSGQSEVRFNVQNQTTEVMGLKSNVKGPSAEWEWNLKEDKTNKVQTISEHSSETQYPSAKCVYEAFQDIPEFVQKQSDWDETDNTKVAYIKNKPTIPVVPTDVSAFNNDAGYITASQVPAQVQSDWSQSDNQAVDFIKNKPTIPDAQVNSDWNAVSGVSQILNKPAIPVVPTDVSAFNNDAGYITINDVPAQVQSDWSQSDTEALDYIKNKPDLSLKEDKSNKIQYTSGETSSDLISEFNNATNVQYASAYAIDKFVKIMAPRYIYHSSPTIAYYSDYAVGHTRFLDIDSSATTVTFTYDTSTMTGNYVIWCFSPFSSEVFDSTHSTVTFNTASSRKLFLVSRLS